MDHVMCSTDKKSASFMLWTHKNAFIPNSNCENHSVFHEFTFLVSFYYYYYY